MKSLLFVPILLLAAARLAAGEVMVFAAASLSDSLREIAADYRKATGETVRFNFAASNILAQQIRAGAPADVFFSADEAKMDALADAGLIAMETRRNLLGNSLVVITPEKGLSITTPEELTQPGVEYFSLGDPRAVPAGLYAKAWLEKRGLWAALQGRIVPAENVRAAMAVVESGNAGAGIVYKTDAALSKKVRIAFEIPAAETFRKFGFSVLE